MIPGELFVADGDIGPLDGAPTFAPRRGLTGVGVHFERLAGHDSWIFDKEWAAAEGVASFAAQPLVARGQTLGVLALFDRQPIPAAAVAWLLFLIIVLFAMLNYAITRRIASSDSRPHRGRKAVAR